MMKLEVKKFIKTNFTLLAITFVIFIISAILCFYSESIMAFFSYKDEVKKSSSEKYKSLSYDFSKLKVSKTENGNYVLIDDRNKEFDLVSKNEIGSYAYNTQGKYFIKYTEPFEEQRNKNIKKFEYDVYNLDKKKVTKRIDLKALLNKYCSDCWWTSKDITENNVVYSVNGKTYITAGFVNPTVAEPIYYFCDRFKSTPKQDIVLLRQFGSEHDIRSNKNVSDGDYGWYLGEVTYGGLYISLDQKDIIKSLLYSSKNKRNVFQKVGSNNSKLEPDDIQYNFIYDKLNERKNPYDNMKKYPEKFRFTYSELVEHKDVSILNKIKTANGIESCFETDYKNPFCKVKIEFNSSDLKSNMTNLFNKYPELKKYVGVKGKNITLFDHDLENDDQVLQLFTPDGKPLTFAGVKDDKVGEITGVADYCQKMKAYNEAHLADDKQN